MYRNSSRVWGMAGRGKGGGGVSKEARLLSGIAQGTAQAVVNAWGNGRSNRRKVPKRKRPKRASGGKVRLGYFDAFNDSLHLALPRAVAPYLVVRTTQIMNPGTQPGGTLAMFGPMYKSDTSTWSSATWLVNDTDANHTLGSLSGTFRGVFASMLNSSWVAASVTPSKCSLQVINTENLQSADGTLYMARAKNRLDLADMVLTQKWKDLAQSLVSYTNPRIISGGKLALRGVQVDLVPNNMNRLSDFTGLHSETASTFHTDASQTTRFDGFNPVWIWNPDNIQYRAIVCTEWRVRFDPGNPAHAAVMSHPPASESTWHQHLDHLVSMGNGVIDIVEKVAASGLATRALQYLA